MKSITNRDLDSIIKGDRELRRDPKFPGTKKDICIVQQGIIKNPLYSYDNIYVVWRKNNEKLGRKLLETSANTGHCLYVDGIVKKDNQMIVGIRSSDPCFMELKAREGSYMVKYNLERLNSRIVIKRISLQESDLFKEKEYH